MQFPEENLNELEDIAVHDVRGHGGTLSGFVLNDDTKASSLSTLDTTM
jgi:hypothetical protein